MGNIEKFDEMATGYDSEERIEISRIISNKIKTYMKDSKDKTAIDFGCGTGLIGLDLLDELHSILFIDASKNMIDVVKSKIKNEHINNASALFCDITNYHGEPIKTDYIIAAQVLLHIKEYEELIKKLFELLNEDGHLIIIDFDKNLDIVTDLVHNGFNQNELASLAKDIGFADTNSETFYHRKNMFMKKDASLFIMDCKK